MIIEYFAFAAVGKLLIFLVQTAGPFRPVWRFLESKSSEFEEMHECGWCVGVWVYTVLAGLLRVDILAGLTYPIIGYIITGVTTSFIVQCVSFGLQTWFGWVSYPPED